MAITLTVTAGPNRGLTFSFTDHSTFLVGRSPDAHFRMMDTDPYFSRIHFLVEINPPLCRLLDMRSRNGTFVNGQKVQVADLNDGDEIQAGQTRLRVSLQGTEKPHPEVTWDAPPAAEDTLAELAAQANELTGTDLINLVRADQERRWRTGEGLLVEVYLQRLPSLHKDTEQVLDLIYQEVLLREESGEDVQTQEFLLRFPQYTRELQRQFQLHRALQVSAADGMTQTSEPRIGQGQTVAVHGADLPQIPGYDILKQLGEGAMGVVYQARRRADDSLVAIKMIRPAVKPTDVTMARFLREASILKELDHPAIVAFRDMGHVDGQLFFVMDFIEGTDAGRILHQEGPLPVGRAVSLVCQLLEALAYAHARGFVHRDVKPGNLLVTRQGDQERVKLADFGLARTYQASQLSGLTITGGTGGTPAYMPPEQVVDFRTVKPTADQYSAAATLYRLLTNKPLYDAIQTSLDLMMKLLSEDPVPIQDRRSDLPTPLAAAIQKALARSPYDRFPDVTAFRQALVPFAAEQQSESPDHP